MTHDDLRNNNAHSKRSRLAIRNAFFGVVLERPYHEIKINDIVEKAGIGRSTFYEHYKSKDDLLATSVEGPFSILAGLVDGTTTDEALVHILEHFWKNRSMARGIFSGAIRKRVGLTLAGMIQKKLSTRIVDKQMPTSLLGIQISEMMLVPISVWVMGQVACNSRTLAELLKKSVNGTLVELKVRIS